MASSGGIPRATFAKLSPHAFLLANLQPLAPESKPTRVNGRDPRQARPPHVNSSSLTHAHGSSLVRVGDTTVICGVRGETIPAANLPNYRESNRESELGDYDLLVPNIELATGSSPQFLPGVPPTSLAQTLSTRAYTLLHSSKLLDADDFRISYTRPADGPGDNESSDEAHMGEEGETSADETVVVAYWVLFIDVFFISYDGNPFDVAWAAILAALRDTRLPEAYWDPDREMVLCSRKDSRPLTVSGLPVACTAAVFTGKDAGQPSEGKFWLLLDPDMSEEEICDETVTAVVDCSAGETKILGISKNGGAAISPEILRQYIGVAESRWSEFADALRQGA